MSENEPMDCEKFRDLTARFKPLDMPQLMRIALVQHGINCKECFAFIEKQVTTEFTAEEMKEANAINEADEKFLEEYNFFSKN